MKFSIIIPCYKCERYIEKCIDSVYSKTVLQDYEIIVVDDCSPEPIPQEIIKKYPDVKFYRKEKNTGFVRTVNFGAGKADGDILVFLNVDTEIISMAWLTSFAEDFKDPRLGIAGGKLIYPGLELIQFAGGFIDSGEMKIDLLYHKAPASYIKTDKSRDVEWIFGALLAVRRDIFFKAGQFSEEFHSSYEDIDFCFKVKQLGFRVYYNHMISVYHYETVTGITDVHRSESLNIFRKKWSTYLQENNSSFYKEDGFSEVFVKRMMKIMNRDFYNIVRVIEAFSLISPEKQEDFILKRSGTEIIDSLLKSCKHKEDFYSELLFYRFRLCVNNSDRDIFINLSEKIPDICKDPYKRDYVMNAAALILRRDYDLSDFCSENGRDIYKVIRRIRSGKFSYSEKNELYEQSLMIKFLTIFNKFFKICSDDVREEVSGFIICNRELFKERTSLISLLYKLAYADYRGIGSDIHTMAEEIIHESVWDKRRTLIYSINSAVFFEKRGDYKRALTILRSLDMRNIESDLSGSISFHLGYIYYKRGDYDKSEEYFKKAEFLNPDNKKVSEYREKIKKERGNA